MGQTILITELNRDNLSFAKVLVSHLCSVSKTDPTFLNYTELEHTIDGVKNIPIVDDQVISKIDTVIILPINMTVEQSITQSDCQYSIHNQRLEQLLMMLYVYSYHHHQLDIGPNIINISNYKIYGDVQERLQSNDWNAGFIENCSYAPTSPDAVLQSMRDQIVDLYGQFFSMRVCTLILCDLFGPYSNSNSALNNAILDISKNRPVAAQSGMFLKRQWIYINDAVTAISDILINASKFYNRGTLKRGMRHHFNIGSSFMYSVAEILHIVVAERNMTTNKTYAMEPIKLNWSIDSVRSINSTLYNNITKRVPVTDCAVFLCQLKNTIKYFEKKNGR